MNASVVTLLILCLLAAPARCAAQESADSADANLSQEDWRQRVDQARRRTDDFVANARNRPRNNAGLTPGGNGLAPVWCHAMVWLDGVRIGTDFSINSLDPSSIKAVEWYAGEGSVPAKFNISQRIDERYCGVLVIWTR